MIAIATEGEDGGEAGYTVLIALELIRTLHYAHENRSGRDYSDTRRGRQVEVREVPVGTCLFLKKHHGRYMRCIS